ncbi:MAG: phosphatidate cytidylyltransferase [Gammaproteobacteria bacterium]
MAESIKKRIVTAGVLIALLLLVVLVLPPIATVIALTVVVLAGAWEWSAFLRITSVWQRLIYVVVVAALLPIVWSFTKSLDGLKLVLSIAVVWWVIALGWVMFAPRLVSAWAAALAGVLALVPAWIALMRLRVDSERGAEWVLFALILVQVADIGAFFVGRRFGRRRLAPSVSPGKTWEGVIGGLIASGLVAILGSSRFGIPLVQFLPLCLAVVAFSIVGDLTESLLKRFAGLKDSGRLFPGHGGVMDRIDSVTAAAPVLFFGLLLTGVTP